jgi:hypothetical protein
MPSTIHTLRIMDSQLRDESRRGIERAGSRLHGHWCVSLIAEHDKALEVRLSDANGKMLHSTVACGSDVATEVEETILRLAAPHEV